MSELTDWLRGVLDDDERRILTVGGDLTHLRRDRKILDLYEAARAEHDGTGPTWDTETAMDCARTVALEEVVRLRAEAYASHPGYRNEWRPA